MADGSELAATGSLLLSGWVGVFSELLEQAAIKVIAANKHVVSCFRVTCIPPHEI
ncbi:hypothetical protein GCM10010911_16710 [Paenibacillus nasutitermitis]|uniref:Uncharacterized protein n=1 Tax=Paenibacillus nasutitermitis TaxID=1652958 RepID=A0A916YSV5_9BACL|nr:hypothetical protein GCM10010911_16710 [Paenibacillus nasutitermitis]